MKQHKTRILWITLALVMGVTLVFSAYAGMGRGGMGRGGGMGPGLAASLTEEQTTQMQAERERFLAETEQLRRDIFDTRQLLRAEMTQAAPDATKSAELQGVLSELEGQMAQQRLNHMLEMRKINPDAGMRAMSGKGGMKGRGMRDGTGPGLAECRRY